MKKLIAKTFSVFFGQDVRVINLPDDNIDMGIYVMRDKNFRKISDKELAEYNPDFAIATNNKDFNSWVYLITVNYDAIIRNNEVISPPDSEMQESVMFYPSAEKALEALIMTIMKDKFKIILMEWSYENE